MIAIVDLSNGITLYTGITCVGKLHISGILSNFTGSNYFLSNNNPKLGSPFPRRSSLIPSQNCSTAHEIKFEEALHLLSPVGGNCARPPILLENSLLDTNLGLKEAVGNEITLECGNKQHFRTTLPTSSTSPLGECRFYLIFKKSEILQYK